MAAEVTSERHRPVEDRILVIQAGVADKRYYRDMWQARELLYMLAKRDIMVRYRQTAVGVLWGWIRPALNILIFTLVFGVVARLPSQEGVPYPVLVMTGLMPWLLFASLLGEMSNSLLNNAHMVSKVYFPRLLIPFSAVPVNLFDFATSSILMVLLMLYYGFAPSWQIIFLPFFILLTILIAMGAGLLFAALNVAYRDFRYIVPFVLSVGWLVSPVGYTPASVPENLRFFFSLNPLVTVIEGFRWSILGSATSLDWRAVTISMVLCLIILIAGISLFRRFEKAFADVI